MRKVHVVFTHQDLDANRIGNKQVVVLDILFATTTIVAALAAGARAVVPVCSGDEARAYATRLAPDSYVLAGELRVQTIEGFAPATPLALLEHDLRDRTLVYSTTNGTVALTGAAAAKLVWVGSLLNAEALTRAIATDGTTDTVVIVCAGSQGAFNQEDFFGAGCLVSRLLRHAGDGSWHLTDAARTALGFYERSAPDVALANGRVGQILYRLRLEHELEYARAIDSVALTPVYVNGAIVRAA